MTTLKKFVYFFFLSNNAWGTNLTCIKSDTVYTHCLCISLKNRNRIHINCNIRSLSCIALMYG